MSKDKQIYDYTLHLGDNALILGQRLSEWCGHGPVLEQDIALTNIALDLIGQARLLFQYASTLSDEGQTENDLAYLRKPGEYYNLLLVEQPNGNFGDTIMRQFFYDAYHYAQCQGLTSSDDAQLAAIAQKSIKEVKYHLRFSSEWVVRLGDGTEESHAKMQTAADNLWMYTGELYTPSTLETELQAIGVAPDSNEIKEFWMQKVKSTLAEATLKLPQNDWMQSGGKEGRHTEHLGYILAELQYLQHTYPGVEW